MSVSVIIDEINSFISPVDRSVSLEQVLALAEETPALASLLPFTFRETLVSPVPFGKNERLSAELALRPGELALRLTYCTGYSYSKTLDMFLPARHNSLEALALAELGDISFEKVTHGTQLGFVSGCRGPLCKRARRIHRVESGVLKKTREHFQKTGKVLRPPRPRYEQMKISVPAYAAVDPLLTALTIIAHLRTPPVRPSSLERQYLQLNTKESLVLFLREQYGEDVF